MKLADEIREHANELQQPYNSNNTLHDLALEIANKLSGQVQVDQFITEATNNEKGKQE